MGCDRTALRKLRFTKLHQQRQLRHDSSRPPLQQSSQRGDATSAYYRGIARHIGHSRAQGGTRVCILHAAGRLGGGRSRRHTTFAAVDAPIVVVGR